MRATWTFLALIAGFSVSAASQNGISAEVRKNLEETRRQALGWIRSHAIQDEEWQKGDTARVVIALAASLDDWPQKKDLISRLLAKQLEIELLAKLLRKRDEGVTPGKIALYSLALTSICKNPMDFYGHNLIASLERHHNALENMEYPETFGFGLASLATCLSGVHLHKRDVRSLYQISRQELKPHLVDTRGMALLALICAREQKKSHHFEKRIKEEVDVLGKLQEPDGTFGNLHSTSIAIQVLSSGENWAWNATAAASALISMQEKNGGFMGNFHATAEALVATSALLNGLGVLGLTHSRCNARKAQPTKTPESFMGNTTEQMGIWGIEKHDLLTLSEPPPPKATTVELANVTYWLWIGPDPLTAERFNLSFKVQVNTTFFALMQKAAETSEKYEFATTVWPNGHYIHTINGNRETPVGYHYWLLYKLKSDPNPADPPPTTFVAPAGVDELYIQDGDVYLFWFKKI